MSLDVAVGEDGDTSLGDLVVNRSAESPFEAVASSLLPDEVARFLGRLSDEERQVLELRYGLDRGEPRTQGEVGPGPAAHRRAGAPHRAGRPRQAAAPARRRRRPRPARQLIPFEPGYSVRKAAPVRLGPPRCGLVFDVARSHPG